MHHYLLLIWIATEGRISIKLLVVFRPTALMVQKGNWTEEGIILQEMKMKVNHRFY